MHFQNVLYLNLYHMLKNSSAISTESFELFFSKSILLSNGKNGGSWSTQKVTQAIDDGLRMWLLY